MLNLNECGSGAVDAGEESKASHEAGAWRALCGICHERKLESESGTEVQNRTGNGCHIASSDWKKNTRNLTDKRANLKLKNIKASPIGVRFRQTQYKINCLNNLRDYTTIFYIKTQDGNSVKTGIFPKFN